MCCRLAAGGRAQGIGVTDDKHSPCETADGEAWEVGIPDGACASLTSDESAKEIGATA